VALVALIMILVSPGVFANTQYWDSPTGTGDAISGAAGRMPERHEYMAESRFRWSSLTGRATVVDGNTIIIRGWRIRLDAIDAPESRQTCEADGQPWRCGQQAALALAEKIGAANVTCANRGRDHYSRTLAICTLGDLDLNGWLVAEGWALAYRFYSTEYVSDEDVAKAASKGVWRGRFVPPWDWRRGVRLADAEPPGECAIKGDINQDSERIYHVPGGRWYAETRISPDRGERWFCTEEEARDAGWRAAGR
jgi:endonuclease YncB( thermonuclease family)